MLKVRSLPRQKTPLDQEKCGEYSYERGAVQNIPYFRAEVNRSDVVVQYEKSGKNAAPIIVSHIPDDIQAIK
ncbi:MAG: hypothetical protein U9O97_07175 [Elusimicrobiota bacterium]|nr:hypothetical protein [Elusimicrobiota bacterium]